MCTYALHVRNCQPKGDGISNREHLLANLLLRICVWLIAITACIGNGLVILGRVLIKEDDQIHSFLIKNLAIADTIMGIYLFIIATKDAIYRGEYILHEKAWRSSWLCSASGILSTLSSEVSVFLLTLITMDRYVCVLYPFKNRNGKSVSTAYCITAVTWMVCVVLSVLPVLKIPYFGNEFYANNGVCLPLHIHDPWASGWEYSALLFIGLYCVGFIVISYAYTRMLVTLKLSQLSLRSTRGSQDTYLVQRFFFIVFTDCVCWMPIVVIKCLSLSGNEEHILQEITIGGAVTQAGS